MVVFGRFWSILVDLGRFFSLPTSPVDFGGLLAFCALDAPAPPPVGICGLTLKPSLGRFLFNSPLSLFFFLSFLPLYLATYFSLSPEPLFVSVCVCLPTPPARPPVLSRSLSLIRLDTELKMFSGKGVNKASHSKNERRQTRGASASVR